MDHVRRLYQQKAPVAEVVAAATALHGWDSPECQSAITVALQNTSVGAVYQQRVLKAIMKALSRDTEVDEGLLALHLSVMRERIESGTTLMFELPGSKEPLHVRVHDHIGGGAETGCMLWPASLFLAVWLLQAENAEIIRDQHVLELGAGVGMLGLALAHRDRVASVTLTDCVVLTLDNLRLNARQLPSSVAPRVAVRHLDWTESCRDQHTLHSRGDVIGGLDWEEHPSPCLASFGLIVAADVVYDPAVLPALVRTLAIFLRPQSPLADLSLPRRALVASERRSQSTFAMFEDLLEQHHLTSRDISSVSRDAFVSQQWAYLSPSVLQRMVLLEIQATGIDTQDPAEGGSLRQGGGS